MRKGIALAMKDLEMIYLMIGVSGNPDPFIITPQIYFIF
jgi:hypothetical protein